VQSRSVAVEQKFLDFRLYKRDAFSFKVRMADSKHRKRLDKSTLSWIEEHPDLIEHLERLKTISEARGEDIRTLDQVERAIIDEVDQLGGETLKQWLVRREIEAADQAVQTKGLRKHSKKNSI